MRDQDWGVERVYKEAILPQIDNESTILPLSIPTHLRLAATPIISAYPLSSAYTSIIPLSSHDLDFVTNLHQCTNRGR